MSSPAYTVPQFAALTGVATSTVYNNVRVHPERLTVQPVRVGTRVTFPAASVHTALGITAGQAAEMLEAVVEPPEIPALTPEDLRILSILHEQKCLSDPGAWVQPSTRTFAGLPQAEHAPIPVSWQEIREYQEAEAVKSLERWQQGGSSEEH